jgi:hypothetical protein
MSSGQLVGLLSFFAFLPFVRRAYQLQQQRLRECVDTMKLRLRIPTDNLAVLLVAQHEHH